MTPEDIRALSDDQLNDEIAKLKKEQFNLRFQRASGQLERPRRFREVRRLIARLKTIQNQKTLGLAPAAKPAKAVPATQAKKAKKEGARA